MNDELKPCPLCGGSAKITGARVWIANNMGVTCQVCGLETRYGQFDDKEDLIKFWNNRPVINETK